LPYLIAGNTGMHLPNRFVVIFLRQYPVVPADMTKILQTKSQKTLGIMEGLLNDEAKRSSDSHL
jgi:hypothetical protein